MKKQIIILLISHLLIFKGISQTSNDSITCIPNSQLKLAINKIEEGKVLKQELQLSKSSIVYLENSNITKDDIIKQYEKKDSLNSLIISGYKESINNLNSRINNSDFKYVLQSVKLKRQKFKKWGTLILGIGIGYLAFK